MYFSFIVTYIESKRGTWWNQTKLPRNGNYLVICQFIGTFKNLDIKFTRRNKYKSLIKRSILTHPSLWIQLQVPLDLITNPLVLAYQILDAIQKIMYATIYNKPLVLKHIWYDCKLFYSDWGFEPNYDVDLIWLKLWCIVSFKRWDGSANHFLYSYYGGRMAMFLILQTF